MRNNVDEAVAYVGMLRREMLGFDPLPSGPSYFDRPDTGEIVERGIRSLVGSLEAERDGCRDMCLSVLHEEARSLGAALRHVNSLIAKLEGERRADV